MCARQHGAPVAPDWGLNRFNLKFTFISTKDQSNSEASELFSLCHLAPLNCLPQVLDRSRLLRGLT